MGSRDGVIGKSKSRRERRPETGGLTEEDSCTGGEDIHVLPDRFYVLWHSERHKSGSHRRIFDVLIYVRSVVPRPPEGRYKY